ncbi:hypothetical protein BDV38DRAFT_239114 [Aspergillus pseudotamarii]|uniref:Uncharacterized protein n=1 Tax=Aspergillus pseudotamarii TaxID=132259 RepID=A0A5N6T3B5_ASPPS|nr:uncharacterized protein BDV38DRAFT_239114 [Aspergillus pseudotamarii]KAE8140691.1 hypothetical protein BDV38DRAFT_239114 [Aspergillus pseudotamarii]
MVCKVQFGQLSLDMRYHRIFVLLVYRIACERPRRYLAIFFHFPPNQLRSCTSLLPGEFPCSSLSLYLFVAVRCSCPRRY